MSRMSYQSTFTRKISEAMAEQSPTPPRQDSIDVFIEASRGGDKNTQPFIALDFIVNFLQSPEWLAVLRALLYLQLSVDVIPRQLCLKVSQISDSAISGLPADYLEIANAYLKYIKAKAYNRSREEFILMVPLSGRLRAIQEMSINELQKETTLLLSLLYFLVKPGPALYKCQHSNVEILNRIAHLLLKDSQGLFKTLEVLVGQLTRIEIEETKLLYVLDNFQKCHKMLVQLYDIGIPTSELWRPLLNLNIQERVRHLQLRKERQDTSQGFNASHLSRSHSFAAFSTASTQNHQLITQQPMMYTNAPYMNSCPMFPPQSHTPGNQRRLNAFDFVNITSEGQFIARNSDSPENIDSRQNSVYRNARGECVIRNETRQSLNPQALQGQHFEMAFNESDRLKWRSSQSKNPFEQQLKSQVRPSLQYSESNPFKRRFPIPSVAQTSHLKFSPLVVVIMILVLLLSVFSESSPSDWSSRTIYNVFVDRFARTNGDTSACSDLGGYCGGSFKGLSANLDYITGLGFDAIWLSDVLEQSVGAPPIGNPSNFFAINPAYGTSDDLKSLIKVCHGKQLKVMVDVNLNSVGNQNISATSPFNRPEYYHPECTIDMSNTTSREVCRFQGYPDLAQQHPYVRRTLVDWINWFTNEYSFDALNFLNGLFVPKDFWLELSQFTTAFSTGYIYDVTIDTNSEYQGSFDSVMNHPMNFIVTLVFSQQFYMTQIPVFISSMTAFSDEGLLVNYVSGVSSPRFLSFEPDIKLYRNAAAFMLTYTGIPSVFYGEEQSFNGGNFPENSAPLWGHMDPTSESYSWFKKLIQFRKDNSLWKFDWAVKDYGNVYLIATRGDTLMCFTNSDAVFEVEVSSIPFFETQTICNVFNSTDCATVKNGKIKIGFDGEVKLYQPEESIRLEASQWISLRSYTLRHYSFGIKGEALETCPGSSYKQAIRAMKPK